jgi:hypothetical protein
VTTATPARLSAPRTADRQSRPRSAHPVHVLRWFRNGMLLCVAAAALLYLWVAIQAGSDVAAVQRTQYAIKDVADASAAVTQAGNALKRVFSSEDVPLVGTGTEFVSQVTLVDKDLTLAAENNAAGTEGTSEIQYAENEFTSYLQLSETAVHDYDVPGPLGPAGGTYASGGEGAVTDAIKTLQASEQSALDAQRTAWALDPGVFWWVLLGPVIGMLALAAATATALARHFWRLASPWLGGSLLITAVTVIIAGLINSADARHLNSVDARHLTADPWAGRPVTMAVALLLFLAAVEMARRAYHPRLAEYLFEPS